MAIMLFTDFGSQGPYIGQMESVIDRIAPQTCVIHLLSDAPRNDPFHSGYLLAALSKQFSSGTIFLAVVDPGVGSDRRAVVVKADGNFFVGPDNGLLDVVATHAHQVEWFEIVWRPDQLSSTFHGRDLFAPVAAWLSLGAIGDKVRPLTDVVFECPGDLDAVIFFDHYGNVITGRRYSTTFDDKKIRIKHRLIAAAETFSAVPENQLFWYENSMGLVEIAANQGHAQSLLGLQRGDPVAFVATQ